MEMNADNFISGGTVTSPRGFVAGAVYAGIKNDDTKLDLGILCSETPCTAAGMFTMSRIRAAAVALSEEKLKKGRASGIVVNSGCANAYTGKQGFIDAEEVMTIAASRIGIPVEDILIASTGVTGQELPMSLIREGIGQITLSSQNGHLLARAIMTTDTMPKEVAVSGKTGDTSYIIGGIAKGSGMIHPNMATMFAFLTTDAAVESGFLKKALNNAVDLSFNMISIDGDTSPSDTVLILANGMAEGPIISEDSPDAGQFQENLNAICIHLAKALARDGEGATKLIEVTVTGAADHATAKTAAKEVIGSMLVKTAIHGGDPNWGRIISAVGQSGIDVELSKVDLAIGNVIVLQAGEPIHFNAASVIRAIQQEVVQISINLNDGGSSATAWGCDLSEEYVAINSEYMT